MSNKQIFISLDRAILQEIKEKAALEEKRSLNSLARKLIADLPRDRVFLLKLGDRLREQESVSLLSSDPVPSTIRISEEELWDLKEKAVKARMNPRELVILLLERWNTAAVTEISGFVEKEDVIKRAS